MYTLTGGVLVIVNKSTKIIEAYIGEYASGKSELAINKAIELKNQNRNVTLVDLDTVEPFYTLRPLKKFLEEQGLNIIGFGREDTFGLGETGAMLHPRAKWALLNEGDIILDVGYGVYGAQTLNLVEGAHESKELKILAVINYTRPMTNSLEKIKDYIRELGRVDGIIANTHLSTETTVELIKKGNQQIIKAAQEIKVPIEYIAIDENLESLVKKETFDVSIKFIKRYMPGAMW
ncbi:hypothetical protein SYNTR_1999 [Candidatus Syntrophocurvum alkaliphilum]|uniref:CobQ/CobB/MinD/ParA nucleotide binding domain-containing protein n=1 Tax=Candidatus Syntrophocurvum alkaliphilum TaxID=2293317 RepID=A0A6I6DHN3_9FIRM|nr:hypothetical protein [Candidatus Syntrophocurvum alkaliphilum]QGU00593.1 hypothetical protein SYNTR_1999 [Candidatus Syntrophocurvum alkaliphilum]